MKKNKVGKAVKSAKAKKFKNRINVKKVVIVLILMVIVFLSLLVVIPALKNKECTTIKSGLLIDNQGNIITEGYDTWGYHYQAHMFKGIYDNAKKPEIIESDGNKLTMKWNDAWLSNVDCDGDNLLDRHYKYPSFIGSGAYLTVTIEGEYGINGEICSWDESYKIEAVPKYSVLNSGYWYSEGKLIGPQIGDGLAISMDNLKDPCGGYNGGLQAKEEVLGFF